LCTSLWRLLVRSCRGAFPLRRLEADANPFAKVVLAHLKALETRSDPGERRAWKFRLVRGLYERGFKAEDVRQLFRLIDWLMDLPPSWTGSSGKR
jgi:hypothetical protein